MAKTAGGEIEFGAKVTKAERCLVLAGDGHGEKYYSRYSSIAKNLPDKECGWMCARSNPRKNEILI